MRQRKGDSAEMAYIELVDREGELRKAKPPKMTLEDIVRKELEKAKSDLKKN